MEIDMVPISNALWANQINADLHNAYDNVEEVSLPTFQFSAQPRPSHVDPLCSTAPLNLVLHEAPNPSNPVVIPYGENLLADPSL